MKPIICFSPLLLLRFYLSPELLQSEKMIFHDDCNNDEDHVDNDNEYDASMMMMIGNLANINLSTVDCIESSDLLGKILTSYHRQKLLSHLEYLVNAGCQVVSGFSSSFFSTEINQAFISLRKENK